MLGRPRWLVVGGGFKKMNESIYRCRLYHQSGCEACFGNTIQEAPLVRCIVRKVQEGYLSDSALARLRKALEREQGRTRPRPRDLVRLKTEISESELESLTQRTASTKQDDSEIDRAIDALRDLGRDLTKARPEETRELLSSIVSRIELRFDHKKTASGRTKDTFRDGVIHLNPRVTLSSTIGRSCGRAVTNDPGRSYDPTDYPTTTGDLRPATSFSG